MLRCASNARPVVLGLATLLLTACGGSPQSIPSPMLPAAGGGTTAGGGSNTGAAFARVKLVIKIPRKAAPSAVARRRPNYVSPSIASVTVSVTAPGSAAASVTSNVVCSTAVPPACTVTASILAPVQKEDTFTVISYDGANATGNVLSQGSTVFPVNAGATEQIPVVLQGTAASVVAVTVANPNPVTGTSATSSVSVTAVDADGNVIVGTYQAPVTLQLFENDSEGLLSFAQGGAIVATGSVTGSATPATVYLKAKADTTTPDDATIVATVGNAPFVPGTSNPAPTTIGEITTTCPATSTQCVFYPNGAQNIANAAINTWAYYPVFAGTPQDPGGATSIWNVPAGFDSINEFNTATDVFAVVTAAGAPTVDTAVDIAGTFWGAGSDPNSGVLGDLQFTTSGILLQRDPLTTTATPQGISVAAGESFDSLGQFWAIDDSYIYAINPSTGASTACSFETTDANFANAQVATLAVAGSVVWMGVNGASDGNTYVFKVPAQITASGCNLTTLETTANKFELTSLAGAFDVNQIVVDAAGDAYALQVSSVWKITQAGQATKIIDTGTALTQVFAGGALDPTGANLYLVDPQSGVLYKTNATGPNPSPLPSIVLPPVLGIVGNFPSVPYYVPFFQPDGTLWIGLAPFSNTALPFSLLGTASTTGGLETIRLTQATFAVRAGAAATTRDSLLRQLRSHRRIPHGRSRSARFR